jgi:putative phage-type endonuclease
MSTGLSTERDKWLAERRKGIGASDAPTVCGVRTRPTRLELWLEKRGEITADEPTEAMRWGLRLEPLIAEAYTERTGRRITRTQISTIHDELPWMRATLDAYDEYGVIEFAGIEFKAVGSWSGRKLPEESDPEGLPEAWIIQGQHQMAVGNLLRMRFAAFADMSLKLYTLERDDGLIADIITMEEEFWRSVQDGTPPAEFQPEDVKVITRHFNREEGEHVVLPPQSLMDIERFAASKTVVKSEQEACDKAKAALLMAMGNAATAECGPYRLKRKLVNIKERTQTIKALSYIRFTCSNGEEE